MQNNKRAVYNTNNNNNNNNSREKFDVESGKHRDPTFLLLHNKAFSRAVLVSVLVWVGLFCVYAYYWEAEMVSAMVFLSLSVVTIFILLFLRNIGWWTPGSAWSRVHIVGSIVILFVVVGTLLFSLEVFDCVVAGNSKRLQLEIFEMVVDRMEEHNITYWLEYGSMLGAIRHHGFIPWDTDTDIAIYAHDLDKTIQALAPLEDFGVEVKKDPAWSIWGHTREGLKIFWGPGPQWMRFYVDIFLFREARRVVTDKDGEKKEECIMYREEAWRFEEQATNSWDTLDKFDCSFLHPLEKYPFEGKMRWGPNRVQEFLTVRFGKDYMIPKLYKQKKLFCSTTNVHALIPKRVSNVTGSY